mmetsp:Transcript_62771/g.132577  ORF Transcript_62771/g.132577 Transcript_62771/m.132577 type:complete len:204 (+) Transcript_62771:366-977(+)
MSCNGAHLKLRTFTSPSMSAAALSRSLLFGSMRSTVPNCSRKRCAVTLPIPAPQSKTDPLPLGSTKSPRSRTHWMKRFDSRMSGPCVCANPPRTPSMLASCPFQYFSPWAYHLFRLVSSFNSASHKASTLSYLLPCVSPPLPPRGAFEAADGFRNTDVLTADGRVLTKFVDDRDGDDEAAGFFLMTLSGMASNLCLNRVRQQL